MGNSEHIMYHAMITQNNEHIKALPTNYELLRNLVSNKYAPKMGN
jgi:hypothetical protein